MDLTNFKRVRIGSHYPQVFGISPIAGHESDGLYAQFHGFMLLEKGQKRVELRCKDNSYALFLFRYDDMELPDWWKDSEVLWELETQFVIDRESAEQLTQDLEKMKEAENTINERSEDG